MHYIDKGSEPRGPQMFKEESIKSHVECVVRVYVVKVSGKLKIRYFEEYTLEDYKILNLGNTIAIT